MNILPKKSWHVRNKANIERVRRDEENARLEEEEKARRAAIAEQEARTAVLRARSQTKSIEASETRSSASKAVVLAGRETKHINFFEDIEQGLQQGSNPEYEAEKKAEKEKYERKIGLLTYVGESSAEAQADKPWYFQPQQKRVDKEKGKKLESSKEINKKNSLDPLRTMTKYLEVKKDRSEHSRKHGRHKHTKHKHKSIEKESSRGKKKNFEELRAERIRREKEEHEREQKLLSRARGEVEKPTDRNDFADRYRYNSQFNPNLVRKPKVHHRVNPY